MVLDQYASLQAVNLLDLSNTGTELHVPRIYWSRALKQRPVILTLAEPQITRIYWSVAIKPQNSNSYTGRKQNVPRIY